MGRLDHLHALSLEFRYRLVEMSRFETEVKSTHGAVRSVSQFQDGVTEFQIGDPETCPGFMLEVFFEAKVLFIEIDRSVQISHMQGHMVDSLVHWLCPVA